MRKNSLFLSLIAASLLSSSISGCAQHRYTSESLAEQQTNSDYLLVPLKANIEDSTTLCAFNASISTFNVYKSETYYDAINRWLKVAGWGSVAWNLPNSSKEALEKHPTSEFSYTGCLSTAVLMLSQKLSIHLNVAFDQGNNIAGVHGWDNRDVQLFKVEGRNLHDAVKTLTLEYGWNWSDKSEDSSWLAAHNYRILSIYPVITLKGDISEALNIVLSKYPVSARLMQSTQKVFVVDEK